MQFPQLLLFVVLLLLTGCPNGGKDDKPPSGADQCLTCHLGIEDIHAVAFTNGQCVVCHGGDAEAVTKEGAHVAIPADYWTIRGDALPPGTRGLHQGPRPRPARCPRSGLYSLHQSRGYSRRRGELRKVPSRAS